MDVAEIMWKGIKSVAENYKPRIPQILTGICVAGIFTLPPVTAIATVKSCKKIEAIKKEKGVDSLSAKEIIKECWYYYIPTAVIMAGSSAAGIASCNESTKRNVILATALQTTEATKNDILEAAEEVVGKKKKGEIESAATQKAINRNPPTDDNIYCTRFGPYLFRENVCGIYFRSDLVAVENGIREFNSIATNPNTDDNDLDYGDLFKIWGVDLKDKSYEPIMITDGTYCKHELDFHKTYGAHPVTGEPCTNIVFESFPFEVDSIMWDCR